MKLTRLNGHTEQTGIAAWQQQLREAMYDAVKPGDIAAIVAGIVKRAREGDPQAVKLLFDYVLGGKQGPPSISNSNVVIQAESPLPQPTKERAGSKTKLGVFRQRAAKGEPLFHPQDGE